MRAIEERYWQLMRRVTIKAVKSKTLKAHQYYFILYFLTIWQGLTIKSMSIQPISALCLNGYQCCLIAKGSNTGRTLLCRGNSLIKKRENKYHNNNLFK